MFVSFTKSAFIDARSIDR
jgi:hypothetical protein